MNRRSFLRYGALTGAGVAGTLAGLLPRRARADILAVLAGRASSRFDFRSMRNRDSWGPKWHPVYFGRRIDVRGGAARFVLPPGLATTAPNQPMPVFLLDHDARRGTQVMGFTVSNATLRVGLLFEGRPPFAYLGVTVEHGSLVLARYSRSDRTVIRRVSTKRLRRGRAYKLKVARSRTRVRAKLWSGPKEPERWSLDLPLEAPRLGCFGVLVVHPTDVGAAMLRVTDYSVSVPGRFANTKPAVVFGISGVPSVSDGGSRRLRVRAASSLPAAIRFEWFYDQQESAIMRNTERRAAGFPFTEAAVIDVPAGRRVRWRARVRSLSSSATVYSDWHSVRPDSTAAPIVLAAASCAHVWRKPTLGGFEQAARAAPAPIRALVYQGDLGYANNIYRSGYLAAQDFFADRFSRFLADPKFASLRRAASVGFILDDHDYGPRNNCWKETVEPWAIELWNRMHADPGRTGYFDFRFADVHCLTLDNRRYADHPSSVPTAEISRLGAAQFDWMEAILRGSDAELLPLQRRDLRLEAGDERLLRLRMEAGVRTRPDPLPRCAARRAEGGDCLRRLTRAPSPPSSGSRSATRSSGAFRGGGSSFCAGLEARSWTPAVSGDPTLDVTRNVMGTSGLGLVVVDPPGIPERTLTLRAIAARLSEGLDLFPPLVLPFHPAPSADVPPDAPAPRPWLRTVPQE